MEKSIWDPGPDPDGHPPTWCSFGSSNCRLAERGTLLQAHEDTGIVHTQDKRSLFMGRPDFGLSSRPCLTSRSLLLMWFSSLVSLVILLSTACFIYTLSFLLHSISIACVWLCLDFLAMDKTYFANGKRKYTSGAEALAASVPRGVRRCVCVCSHHSVAIGELPIADSKPLAVFGMAPQMLAGK